MFIYNYVKPPVLFVGMWTFHSLPPPTKNLVPHKTLYKKGSLLVKKISQKNYLNTVVE